MVATASEVRNIPQGGAVLEGRYVAENDRDVVVFVIGMRFNGWRGIANAFGAFFRMPGMLEEITRRPELGCLAMRGGFTLRDAMIVQYWRSFEDLERYAQSPEFRHRGAWGWYNRLGRNGRDAGIWHETYRVPAGAYEGMAVNMPRAGLAAALGSAPADAARQSARRRLGL
ncbi:MAG: DUF4188 domain-containing protein [Candidatus Eremiobacteraeota bacterium]|nr:DUF4188 domain-containing protein [Candidatus Eremiobacteraeota bacterium]